MLPSAFDGRYELHVTWISRLIFLTLLTNQLGYSQLGFSDDRSIVTVCVDKLETIAGMIIGHSSDFIGRLLEMMISCVRGRCQIYPWAFIHETVINTGAIFLQLSVQSSWSVIPIHSSELSPPEFRVFVVGVSCQLGNLAASASPTIESTIGERYSLYDEDGNIVVGPYNYGKLMVISVGVLVTSFIGPENRHASINFVISEEEKLDLANQGKIVTHRMSNDLEEQMAVAYLKDDTKLKS